MKNICDKCGGAGTLTKEPEVITVRITKGGSVFGEGKVHQVKPSFIHNIIGYTDKGWAVYEDIAEVIPPYDKTKYRLRRKWGKDEEKVYDGDMSYHKGVWSVVIFGGPLPQQRKYIYITPIKPATPDPSADKPPIGIIPKTVHASIRRMSIKSAIRRYTKADKEIPLAWIHEYNELVVEMKKESE